MSAIYNHHRVITFITRSLYVLLMYLFLIKTYLFFLIYVLLILTYYTGPLISRHRIQWGHFRLFFFSHRKNNKHGY